MKFKVGAVLAISLMFTITNCISFAEIGNSDVKTVKSITVSEKTIVSSEAPATDVVAPEAPATDVIVPEVPATDVAVPEAPVTDVIVPEAPATDVVVPEAPATDVIVPEAPATDVVVPEAPVIGEVVDIADQPVAIAPSLPEIKTECSLVVTNKIKSEDNEFVYAEKVVGLHVGDVVNLSDYIHENEDVKAITQGESIVLKEGVNEVVVEYQCVLLDEEQVENNSNLLTTDADEWTK